MSALDNRQLFAERPAASVLICVSKAATEAAHKQLSSGKGQDFATELPDDLSILSGHKVVLFMLPAPDLLIDQLSRAGVTAIKIVGGDWDIAADPDRHKLVQYIKDHGRLVPKTETEAANDAAAQAAAERVVSDGDASLRTQEAANDAETQVPAGAAGAQQQEARAPGREPGLLPAAATLKRGKPRSFAAYVAEHYSDPEAVLATFRDDAAAAAKKVGAELDGALELDECWHYLPSMETGKSERRHSYCGGVFKHSDGVLLPAITFKTFKGGGQTEPWSPREALWDEYQRWKSGAPSRQNDDRIAAYVASAKELQAKALRAREQADPDADRRLAKVQDDFRNGDEAPADYDYFVRKQGKPDGLRVVSWKLDGWGNFKGESLLRWLMVPGYEGVGNTGEVKSIQYIGPNKGEKLNAAGVPIKGRSFTVGTLQRGEVAYVVEGIGHAWSLNTVTDGAAVVSFGAGFIEVIAAAVQAAGSIPMIVCDRGKEKETARIAARLGCLYTTLPADLPDGADVNDLYLERGADAVRAVLDAPIRPQAPAVAPVAPPDGIEGPPPFDFDEWLHDAPQAAKPTLPPYAFIRVGDMRLKAIDWLIRRYLEGDSLALLFSDPGVGKSFMAIDMACCVATGRPWHGNATTKGAVFYIAGEGHNGLKRRFTAWEIDNGVDLNDAPLYVSTQPAKLSVEDSAQAVIDAVRTLASQTGVQPRLIVVDTVARNFGPGDENSTQEMGEFIANLDRLKNEFNATVLLVHHSGHGDKSRARGSMALKGALDAEYRLERGDDEAGVIRFETTKMKEAEFPEPLSFRLESVKLPLLDDEGNEMTSAVMRATMHVPKAKPGKVASGRNQLKALQILRQLEGEHRAHVEGSGRGPEEARVKEDDWRARLVEGGINRFAYRDVKKSLLAAARIEVDSGGYVREA